MFSIPIYGHRGCRALYPENSLEGFQHALNLGIQGIELDVVISKDGNVVVSHEPWMHKFYCTLPNSEDITEEHNLFQMDYKNIKKFDTGSKFYLPFPLQEKLPTYKPLLKEVLHFCNDLEEDFLIILELKSETKWINKYQPILIEYVQLVESVLRNIGCNHRLLIQSFDSQILNTYYHFYPYHCFGLLVENNYSVEQNLSFLNFTPHFYNQEFTYYTENQIKHLHSLNIRTIAWTVNDYNVGRKLEEWNIDGIITDNPLTFM